MDNRKQPQKQQINPQTAPFKVGDSVVAKAGVNDPDYGGDISGWQGRITEIMTDNKGVPTVMIAWDSLTLKRMPASFLKESARESLSWERMGVFTTEVELTQPRDTPVAVKRAIEEIGQQYAWAYLGEEGDRIQEVLKGIKGKIAAFKAWHKYLSRALAFPFEAEVSEWQDRGPLKAGDRVTVLRFEGIKDLYGILVNIQTKRGDFVFPLCDLEAANQNSPNYQPLNDYDVWFANR